MKRYVTGLLVAVGLLLVMAVPALAQPEEFPGEGSGASDSNPGVSEGSTSHVSTPPGNIPGAGRRSAPGDKHDTTDDLTRRGERNQ